MPPRKFSFDDATHTYRLDGKVIPSVTQILKPLYDFSFVNRVVLARAASFGTALHKACELHLSGSLDENSLDENLKRPLEAFRQWADSALNGECYVCEMQLYHPRLKYAGTADIIIDGQAVVDIKSRPFSEKMDPLQLVAYEHMWMNTEGHSPGPYKHIVLELRLDGTFVETSARRPKTWEKFRYLLDYHNMTQEINRWKGQ